MTVRCMLCAEPISLPENPDYAKRLPNGEYVHRHHVDPDPQWSAGNRAVCNWLHRGVLVA